MRCAMCVLGRQAILLKGVHVTRGAVQVSDGEAAVGATNAFGDLRVDTMAW